MKMLGIAMIILVLTVTGIAPAIAQVSITDVTSVYTQDFNTLGYTPDLGYVTWTDNGSLPGWYANAANYRIVYNKSTEYLYSYGLVDDPERALGSITDGDTSTYYRYGVLLRNQTGQTMIGLSVTYAGEQWRKGSDDAPDYMVFHYKTSSTPIALSDSGFTEVPELKFTTPISDSTIPPAAYSPRWNSPLNGNLAEFRTVLSHSFAVSIPNGSYVMLRWWNTRDLSSAHGIGLDDLSAPFEFPPTGTSISIR